MVRIIMIVTSDGENLIVSLRRSKPMPLNGTKSMRIATRLSTPSGILLYVYTFLSVATVPSYIIEKRK